MLQLKSIANVADNTGAKKLSVIHVFGGSKRKFAYIGDVVNGVISGVADFGAFFQFADNPKIEGLIHISELDHRLIENPKEIVKVGDAVQAKIVEIKEGRVSLSLKALKPNPWDTIESQFKAGDEITGTINRFNPFGAFVGITPDIQGLIHVSEFGSVEKMRETIEVGKQYQFKIELMKPSEKSFAKGRSKEGRCRRRGARLEQLLAYSF